MFANHQLLSNKTIVHYLVGLLLFLSCEVVGPELIHKQFLRLDPEEIGTTQIWLGIRFEDQVQRKTVVLFRNKDTLRVCNLFSDTILIDRDNVLPGRTYVYSAHLIQEHSPTYLTPDIEVRTLDTTSHSISLWRLDTLGGPQSYVFGLWGSTPDDIYAVGYFTSETLSSTIAHWNGSKWTYLRPEAVHGALGIQSGTLIGIFGLSAKKIWLVGQGRGGGTWSPDSTWGFVAEWDGIEWRNISPEGPHTAFFSVWASSENDVWVTGSQGSIYRYNGVMWRKIESGTTFVLRDIYGLNAENIYAVGWPDDLSGGIVLKYEHGDWETVQDFVPESIASFWSVWLVSSRFAYLASDFGIYSNQLGAWQNLGDLGLAGAFYKVRGLGKSDVFVCGNPGVLAHHNGTSWKTYGNLFSGSDNWVFYDIAVFDRVIFWGGEGGFGFERKGLVLRAER